MKLTKALAWRLLSWLTSPQVAYLVGQPLFWLAGRYNDKGQALSLTRVKRALVVRLDKIGDVLVSTPFLRELRRSLPNAWITLVVQPQVHNLVELCPYVDEVLIFDWKVPEKPRGLARLRQHGRAIKLAQKHLWHRRFDLALEPRWGKDYFHASFVTYFSGACWRVGYTNNVYSSQQEANNSLDRLFTHVLASPTLMHEVEANLDIVRFLGGTIQEDRLELWLDAQDATMAAQILKVHKVHPANLLIAFGPGAGAPKRMWPLAGFVKLGAWLKRVYQARIVVLGGPGEESLGEQLRQQLGDAVINVVGQITLRQTAALLKHCCLYVGNDSGIMHMAAAADVPVVEISCHPVDGFPSHPFSPMRWRPWGVSHYVLQPEKPSDPSCADACHAELAHCIRGITVEQVKAAVTAQLGQDNHITREQVLKHDT